MARKVLIVGMLVMVLMALSLGAVSAQDTTTIRYFTFSAAPDHLQDLNKIVQAFQDANKGITVNVETAAFADYFTLLQADTVGGAAPDVFELNYENFGSYVSNGALADLTSSISADAPYYPRALEVFQKDGKQYALPESFSTVVLFYNKDLFDKAGVGYPTKDWTWDDAMTAAKAIRALGDDTWGLYSPIQFYEFYKKAAQNGDCKFFNDAMTESTINSAACVATLDLMTSFLKEGVMPTTAQLSGVADADLFNSGKLGMDVTGIWEFAAFKDAPFKWDIQVEPMIKQHAAHFFANGIAVSASSANVEAAAKWAQFLTSSETAATVRVSTGWELPALNEPSYFTDYLKQTLPDNRQAVFDSLEGAVVPPVIARQSEMQDAIGNLVGQVADGTLTSQDALDQAKAQLDELLKPA
ncbi:MAG: sugar ABC transporter substrate-binding protein [Chloroflexota bacterium]